MFMNRDKSLILREENLFQSRIINAKVKKEIPTAEKIIGIKNVMLNPKLWEAERT